MFRTALLLAALAVTLAPVAAAEPPKTHHKTVKVGDLDIFCREAGPKDAPVVLLLHGFPTSSQMFRHLIPQLADKYRVIAPDYPGFGHSSMPARDQFAYTFDRLAEVVEQFTEKLDLKTYALYVQDYGASVCSGVRDPAAPPWSLKKMTGVFSSRPQSRSVLRTTPKTSSIEHCIAM